MPTLTGVEGSATYNGGATGVYVKNVLDDQGEITSATAGQFSATAESRLRPSVVTTEADEQSSSPLRGKITGFALEHGEENDWAVKLWTSLTLAEGMPNDDPGEVHSW